MELLDMMEQGLSFHFKDGKHIKPTSCNVIEDMYKVWWRRILSLSNWLHCALAAEEPAPPTVCQLSPHFGLLRRQQQNLERKKAVVD